MKPELLLSCEHASNAVPSCLQYGFTAAQSVLASHRGFDAGAWSLAQRLADRTNAPLRSGRYSRLLIDLNRSLDHPQLYSSYALAMSDAERQQLRERYYLPWRRGFRRWCERRLALGHRVVHLSVHSFTPELDGKKRDVELAWLYDTNRPGEVELVQQLIQRHRSSLPTLRLGENTPYRGSDDGHTTSLRQRWGNDQYLGLELEVSHSVVFSEHWAHVQSRLVDDIVAAIHNLSLAEHEKTS